MDWLSINVFSNGPAEVSHGAYQGSITCSYNMSAMAIRKAARLLILFYPLSLTLLSYFRRSGGAAQYTYRKNISFKHGSGINTGDPTTELFALPGPATTSF